MTNLIKMQALMQIVMPHTKKSGNCAATKLSGLWKTPSRGVLLLLTVFATSCAALPDVDRVQVVRISVPQKPIILSEIPRPDPQGPKTYTMERELAINLLDACEAFQEAGKDGMATMEDIQERYPGMDQSYACDFVVYGLSPDAQLDHEAELIDLRAYADKIRARLEFYKQQLINQYESLAVKPESEKITQE